MTSTTQAVQKSSLKGSSFAFGVFLVVSGLVFFKAICSWVSYSLSNESASHVILIPLISAYLLITERARIFARVRRSLYSGAAVVALGIALYWTSVGNRVSWAGSGSLSVMTLALAVVWVGGFLLVYGPDAARAAWFPLLFLVLMVPLPEAAQAWAVRTLQAGSTDVTQAIFNLLGVPVFRQGFVLALPAVTIQVAEECSGIRSSIALFITCILAAHFSLRTPWKVVLFLGLVLPLVVIKNGIRIATLTLLSIYVNSGFLHGRLHRDGGVVFFLLAMLLLLPVFLKLAKSERPARQQGALAT